MLAPCDLIVKRFSAIGTKISSAPLELLDKNIVSVVKLNKIIAKNISYYLESSGKTQLDLATYMGVSQASVSNWCKGIKIPRMDKIDKICSFFHILRSDLMEDHFINSQNTEYYLDDDAKDMAQFLYENPDYKVLFDASRKVKKEDIEFVKQMLDRFNQQ